MRTANHFGWVGQTTLDMQPDDFRQPLKRRGWRERLAALKPSALMSATVLTIGAFVAAGVWAVRHEPVVRNEPLAMVKVQKVDPTITASVQKAPEPEPEPQREDVAVEEVPYDPSNEVIDLDLSGDEPQRSAAVVQPRRQRLAAAPIKSVSERGPHGVLPRVSKAGKKPWLVYAAKTSRAVLNSNIPKVAIVLGGMGINAKLTQKAIEELPGEISLAFAPYGKGLQRKINKARRAGHEVILQLPMEPFGYPSVDPGPRTLLTGAAPAKTLDDLKWHMSRFAGYTGVMNYLGARFSSDGESFAPVLREFKKRGLVYLDDGSSGRSMAPALGQVIGLPVRTAVEVIDSEPNYNGISAALARLEVQAARDGVAIGTGTGLAVTIDALDSWLRDLSARNITLVPASAAYRGRAG